MASAKFKDKDGVEFDVTVSDDAYALTLAIKDLINSIQILTARLHK
jgi:hypothetical protein